MKLRIVFLLLFGLSLFAVSQDDSHFQRKEQYINKFKQYAIDEMKSHGVPASITLAQALVETDAGKSDLAVIANNHFGIKCHKDWQGTLLLEKGLVRVSGTFGPGTSGIPAVIGVV